MNLAVSLLLLLSPVVGSSPWNDEARLVGELLGRSEYDTSTRPVRNASRAVRVALGVDVFTVQNLDSKEQKITVVSAFNMKWQDERLQWDPDVYGGLEYLSLAAERVWYPRLRILNALEETRLIKDETEVFVTSEGVLYITNSLIHQTQCHLDQKAFPFDVQNCNYLVGTVNAPSDSLTIEASEVDEPREGVRAAASWRLEYLRVSNTKAPTCIDANGAATTVQCHRTSMADVTLTLRRESTYYVYSAFVPCTILTLLASVIFWLPTECGERLSFGISILFGFVIFQLLVQDSLSEAGVEKPPVLIRYVLFNFVLVGVAVMVTAISIALHHKGSAQETSGGSALCKSCQSKVEVGVEVPHRTPHDGTEDHARDSEEKLRSRKKEARNWKRVARYLDRVSFVTFYVAFTIFVSVIGVEVNGS
ncbi:acetylcholine receptor subunit beta-like [Acanthaster planci]|uniref:Acetylcholine receptor subunit beta-like n=1 Tax=Acanthaster planci TaxID=133434 RepID=A0A8B7XWY2_ACAPL|nr:acetylcholine receptor subunit beta-like [Acanthaster planci]XP_022085385.1 acetylcholine receptor subunit beta-like [Acanthaster planci]